MSRKSNQEFNDSLTRIAQFLCEDKDKADYVIMCFNKQLQYDIQEMEHTEGIETKWVLFSLFTGPFHVLSC